MVCRAPKKLLQRSRSEFLRRHQEFDNLNIYGAKMKKIERALISLTDKSGIETFAQQLSDLGIEILSTGGTAKKMRGHGINVISVSDFTGFPEMLDGRVKTLHPKIHGGILAQRDNADHQAQMKEHGLSCIDLIAVNLYAFDKATSDPNCTVAKAIENIDIGGPTMLRAAAKNFQDVTVIVDPADYPQVIKEIKAITAWLKKVDVETNSHFQGD
jgi:phosphoribosylaminoimidazolecarboxamide formyltransferase/IMP cyclohydrolase